MIITLKTSNMGFFNLFSSHKETQKQNPESETLDMFANLSQAQKFAMVTMLSAISRLTIPPVILLIALNGML